MANKPFKYPLIIIRGCKSIAEALEMFPFDYVYKFCLLHNIKWLIGNSYRYPQIADMVALCHNLNESAKQKQKTSNFVFDEDKGFRVIINNNQIELTYELKTE